MIEEYIEQKILVDENDVEYLSPLRTRRRRFVPDEILDEDCDKEVLLRNIIVVTDKGTWKADEVSQARMSNAIDFLSRKPEGTIKKWKMIDKQKVDVVQVDIEEAFDLAVAALDAIIVG